MKKKREVRQRSNDGATRADMHTSPLLIAVGAIAAIVVVGLIIWLIVYLASSSKSEGCAESRAAGDDNSSKTLRGLSVKRQNTSDSGSVSARAASDDEPARIASPRALESELRKIIETEKFEAHRVLNAAEAREAHPRQVSLTLGDEMAILPVEVIVGDGGWSTMPLPSDPFPAPLPGPIDYMPIGDWVQLPGWGGSSVGDPTFESPPFNPDAPSRQFWITQWRLVVALLIILRRLRGGRGTERDRRTAALLVRLILLNQRRFALVIVMRRRQREDELARALYNMLSRYLRALVLLALLSDAQFPDGRERLGAVIVDVSSLFSQSAGVTGFGEQLTWFTDRALVEAQYSVRMSTRDAEDDAAHADALLKLTSRAMTPSQTPSVDAMLDADDEDFERALAARRRALQNDGEAATEDDKVPAAPAEMYATPLLASRAIGDDNGAIFATPIAAAPVEAMTPL